MGENVRETAKTQALEEPLLVVQQQQQQESIPNLSHSEWVDRFYDDDPTVLVVFDIQYELLIKNMRRSKWFPLALSFVLVPTAYCFVEEPVMAGLFLLVFAGMWYGEKAKERRIRGLHVALTARGIRRDVVDEQSVQTTLTIPFDYIQSIECHPKLYDRLCKRCSSNNDVIESVIIWLADRRSRPIEIQGLVDALGFARRVKNMMRTNMQEEQGSSDDVTTSAQQIKANEEQESLPKVTAVPNNADEEQGLHNNEAEKVWK